MKRKGFTLIEMLIVVAIIGILAALLIPNAMSALQKSKQKGTMKDMNSLSTAIMDYITDKGYAPTHQWGSMEDSIVTALQGFYLKIVPRNDQWGTRFYILGGTGTSGYTNVVGSAADDYIVASLGRNKSIDPIKYDPTSPGTGYFDITGMSSFNNDLVIWNGSWVSAPKSGQLGS